MAPESGTRKLHLVKNLFDEETNLFIEDHAFAFMSPNDLQEDKDMTVVNFTPTNCMLNSSFK